MEFLNEEQVRSVLTYQELIPAVEQALIDLSTGRVRQPVRSVVPSPAGGGLLGLMPVVSDDLTAVKLVTVFENNAANGMPTHQAVIQLFSSRTGEPLVAMDGRLITEMRTAAVSAVATRLLTAADARVLAILGSGVQARSHLKALRVIRDFKEVRVWSRTPKHAARFGGECGAVVCDSAEAAVHGADVVVSVTSAREPVLRGSWLGPRTLVCAVGAVGLDRRELDDAAMDAVIVVESREAALRESGDIVGGGASITAELGQLLSGSFPTPDAGRRIVFKSLGVAVTDLAAARLVWDKWSKKQSLRIQTRSAPNGGY